MDSLVIIYALLNVSFGLMLILMHRSNRVLGYRVELSRQIWQENMKRLQRGQSRLVNYDYIPDYNKMVLHFLTPIEKYPTVKEIIAKSDGASSGKLLSLKPGKGDEK